MFKEKSRHVEPKHIDGSMFTNSPVFLSQNVASKHCNVLIAGASGSGKTFNYAIPNLMQMNSSYVIYDPRGELYLTTAAMFKENGYKVKTFEISSYRPENSHYNPFEYISSENDIEVFADILTENFNSCEDPFFKEAMKLYLYIVIDIVYNEDTNATFYTFVKKVQEFANMEKSIRMYLYELVKNVSEDSLLYKKVKLFLLCSYKTIENIVAIVYSHLETIDEFDYYKDFVDHADDIEFGKFFQEKTVLFIIGMPNDPAINALFGNFISQALRDDRDRHERLIHVRFILDEFPSLPKIPDLPNLLKTLGYKNMSVEMFIQSITQLFELYGEEDTNVIFDCTKKVILGLGCLDDAEYVSEAIGVTTIRNEVQMNDGSILISEQRRDISPESFITLPKNKCLILAPGEMPIISDKFDPLTHPNYRFLNLF